MSKARNESASRERDVVATAARLFKEKGYRATTLEDSAAVGMLKGSLYYYPLSPPSCRSPRKSPGPLPIT